MSRLRIKSTLKSLSRNQMSRGRKENASLSFVQSRIYPTPPLKKGHFRVRACASVSKRVFM